MELTKQFVEQTKKSGEAALISLISQIGGDKSKLNFILENLGYIPKDFKGEWLFKYMEDNNHKLRMSAIRNIGKLKLNGELNQLYEFFNTEPKTEIKREIISSIGRQRIIK
ncbi:MAG: hypothetical protein OXH57_09310 [Ekhidna sp.]|nr:hypothetical protein [Ekhidna sp.]